MTKSRGNLACCIVGFFFKVLVLSKHKLTIRPIQNIFGFSVLFPGLSRMCVAPQGPCSSPSVMSYPVLGLCLQDTDSCSIAMVAVFEIHPVILYCF